MKTLPIIDESDLGERLNWPMIIEALAEGHRAPPARIADMLIANEDNMFLNRAAWLPGVGFGVKSVSVMAAPAAAGRPSVQGVMILFDEATGAPQAILDSKLVTYWKTACDSGLGARYLAKPDSRKLVIVGAGRVAESLAEVYTALFPHLESILIWNRSIENAIGLASKLRSKGIDVDVTANLAPAVSQADIVASATMTREPVLQGRWIKPGTHVDLVGAFRADMREADDTLLRRARIFVDSRETTLDHIGELKIPLEAKVISRDSIVGDLYDLVAGRAGRVTDQDITVFKNGGGAHLDLMTARAILDATGASLHA